MSGAGPTSDAVLRAGSNSTSALGFANILRGSVRLKIELTEGRLVPEHEESGERERLSGADDDTALAADSLLRLLPSEVLNCIPMRPREMSFSGMIIRLVVGNTCLKSPWHWSLREDVHGRTSSAKA